MLHNGPDPISVTDCYSVSELSRFVSNPGKVHLEQAKRVFRYLSKTSALHLEYFP